MRRRRLHYLAILLVCALSTYLYFGRRFTSAEWAEDVDLVSSIPGKSVITNARFPTDVPKRDAVVEAFKWAWGAYERDAMGCDEYHPIRHRGSNLTRSGGIGYTVIDAIDTMWLMGLDQEYARASRWVKNDLKLDRSGDFNTFETTIRVLGGLLSAFHLTSDSMYLKHAVNLADRMLPAFDTPTGLPTSLINLLSPEEMLTPVNTAEAGTLQLEFRYLAQLTGNAQYWHKAERAIAVINAARIPNGLAPIRLNAEDGSFIRSEIRLGSGGDSYYEYLLKQYLQTGGIEPVYLQMYRDAMQGIHDNLIQRTPTSNITYIAEFMPDDYDDWKTSWKLQHRQEHLACFLAGSLMLGAVTTGAISGLVSVPPRAGELSDIGMRDWQNGVDLLEGCMETHKTATGLSPEAVEFHVTPNEPGGDWYIKFSTPGIPPPRDAQYVLRPETVESLFIAWRLTGDIRYREYSWAIFSAIEKHCRLVQGGYATVRGVDRLRVEHDDKQETFFLSETLKYLFLTFSDESVLPLNDYVFNTEAHPLPVFRPSIKPLFTKYS
ncbi:glycoside hydrolase family 47 protein [Mycena rebaudengoi]|nr:glycoside hydrolase family 47 protein [Mycena rebaudengoi]